MSDHALVCPEEQHKFKVPKKLMRKNILLKRVKLLWIDQTHNEEYNPNSFSTVMQIIIKT
jgi:hypothetical protein